MLRFDRVVFLKYLFSRTGVRENFGNERTDLNIDDEFQFYQKSQFF